ncbi:hypothetical protein [Liquorilactobacillus vini]|uniref:Uncharacterized protein n=1 Tax=Liquorilactobacillus vini DSM 20605 TaxID=1133569 RepID=A0A0R2CBT6_9LACO|nr:hypothetical protein [Liquorilactobacillus vini]KRM89192.1 hypothetical protein FD21_GL000119 [Liquorilactobacillus vini DSM 20605]
MNWKHFFKKQAGKHMESDLPASADSANNEEIQSSETEFSRTAYQKSQQVQSQQTKRDKLARKLNWVIFYLVLAIILVYGFMFFVNF